MKKIIVIAIISTFLVAIFYFPRYKYFTFRNEPLPFIVRINYFTSDIDFYSFKDGKWLGYKVKKEKTPLDLFSDMPDEGKNTQKERFVFEDEPKK